MIKSYEFIFAIALEYIPQEDVSLHVIVTIVYTAETFSSSFIFAWLIVLNTSYATSNSKNCNFADIGEYFQLVLVELRHTVRQTEK